MENPAEQSIVRAASDIPMDELLTLPLTSVLKRALARAQETKSGDLDVARFQSAL